MMIPKVLIPFFFLLAAVGSKAQTSKAISDEDLKKYAIAMDSVEGMQETLRQIVAENVQKNTVMPVVRYNELFKIIDDASKLKESNATPEEIAFIKQINDLRTVNLSRINASYQSLAKDFVGLKAFNAIRKSLNTDKDLKARYDNFSKNSDTKQKGG